MTRDITVYMEDILEAIEKIREYTNGMDEVRFSRDTAIQAVYARIIDFVNERHACETNVIYVSR